MIRSVDDLILRFKLLTVVDLKKQLKSVGLRPRGLKRDLVKQLAEKEYNRMVVRCVAALSVVYGVGAVPCSYSSITVSSEGGSGSFYRTEGGDTNGC